MGLLSRMAALGSSASPAARARLDAFLAPTAWWYVQRTSARIREGGDVSEFDAYWGKLLLPTGTWADIIGWSQNDRFRAVARLEFLRSRYAKTERYRRAEEVFMDGGGGKLRADRLPTRRQLISVFGMEDWNWSDGAAALSTSSGIASKRTQNLEDLRKNEITQTRVRVVDGGYDLTSPIRLRGKGHHPVRDTCDSDGVPLWDLEDVLEAGGCCVHGRSEFNLFSEENQMYEVFTREYVDTLVDTIIGIKGRRHGERDGSMARDFVVVEIGAGTGALSHHMRRRLYELEHKGVAGVKSIDVIATDSGSWKLDGGDFPVEPYNVKEALERLKPDLVITSWMPAGEDWTKDFRRAAIPDYLLIGEADDGCTGHNWLTWGNKAYMEAKDHERKIGGRSIVAPFAEDGYKRTDLQDLAQLQLQRYDCKMAPNQSTTVLFSKSD
eukprot:g133.t1